MVESAAKGRVARAKVASKGGEGGKGGEGRAVRVRAVRVRGMEWRTYLDRRYTKVNGRVKTSAVESCYVPEPFYSFFFILPYVNLFSATHGDSQA